MNCPYCGSENLSAVLPLNYDVVQNGNHWDIVEIDTGDTDAQVVCGNCGREFEDSIDVSDVQTGTQEEAP